MRALMSILLTLGLFSCGERYLDNQVAFEGIKFRADLNKVNGDDFAFNVRWFNARQT